MPVRNNPADIDYIAAKRKAVIRQLNKAYSRTTDPKIKDQIGHIKVIVTDMPREQINVIASELCTIATITHLGQLSLITYLFDHIGEICQLS